MAGIIELFSIIFCTIGLRYVGRKKIEHNFYVSNRYSRNWIQILFYSFQEYLKFFSKYRNRILYNNNLNNRIFFKSHSRDNRQILYKHIIYYSLGIIDRNISDCLKKQWNRYHFSGRSYRIDIRAFYQRIDQFFIFKYFI